MRTCPICNFRGHQLVGFIYHMMKEHNDMSYGTVEIYKCDDCDFQSCYPWTVQKHTQRVHGALYLCCSHPFDPRVNVPLMKDSVLERLSWDTENKLHSCTGWVTQGV